MNTATIAGNKVSEEEYLKMERSSDQKHEFEDGKIIEVGDFLSLSKNDLDVREITYPCVLLPGFIDSHTHVCHYGNRSDEYAKRNSGISYQQILLFIFDSTFTFTFD